MSEIAVTISPEFHRVYPRALVGVLLLENVAAPAESPALEQAALSIEDKLRRRFADKTALRAHPILQAYKDYYKKFDKTYHVQSQLESVVFGGRSIPRPLPLVQAMFMASRGEVRGEVPGLQSVATAMATPASRSACTGGGVSSRRK